MIIPTLIECILWNLWDTTEPRKNKTLPEENIAPEDPALDSLPETVKSETGEGIQKGKVTVTNTQDGYIYRILNFDL